MKIAIVGSGGWGTALAVLLANKGYDINMWSWRPEEAIALQKERENKEFLPGVLLPSNINCTGDLEFAVNGADLVVSAVRSQSARDIAKRLSPLIKEGTVLLNVSKGLEKGTHKRLSEIFEEEVPQTKIASMSGPSHAEEVGRGIPTTNVVASKDEKVAEFVQDIFMCQSFRVYTNPDIVGVELGGALKNVIALAAGICDGLGFGDNTKAALMTRGMVEIARLGVKMGAQYSTFAGLSGIGDLIVTCTSMHSRNRRAGILIGQGYTLEEALEKVHMVVEGVTTCETAYHLAKREGVEMPIVFETYQVLFCGKKAKDTIVDLMGRDKKRETEAHILKWDTK